MNKNLVIEIYHYIRGDICKWKINNLIENGPTLGGEDVVVQIDESLQPQAQIQLWTSTKGTAVGVWDMLYFNNTCNSYSNTSSRPYWR